MNKKVYLAGPIMGISYQESTDWRQRATNSLSIYNIDGFSPMRGKAYLSQEDKLLDSYTDHTMSSINGINIRDYNDVKTADAILVNLLGARIVSIGTVMEVAWARVWNIPVVLVMEDFGNVHEHGMLTYNCIRVNSLLEGVRCIKQLLLP